MSLADFEPRRELVSFQSGSLSVRGLALDDISVVLRDHMRDLDALLNLYGTDGVGGESPAAVAASAQLALVLVREMPALVAQIIALACDEPALVDKAKKLPLPVQVDLLKKVIELTFYEAGGVKKFAETLMSLLAAVRPAELQRVSNI